VRHAAALRAGPSLLLTAHFGNWEAQAAAWRRRGVPLLGAARTVKSSVVAAWVARIRAHHDIPVIHSGADSGAGFGIVRAALRHLRPTDAGGAGGCFGLLWDQHAPSGMREGMKEGSRATFLGAPVALDPLPFFLLACRPCPAYFGVLSPDGVLRLIPLLDPTPQGVHGLRDGWEERLARRYHRVLAALVRAHPARWHGVLHARFKAAGKYPGHRGAK
jgi:lauroyl/myristoyl acyltransferase